MIIIEMIVELLLIITIIIIMSIWFKFCNKIFNTPNDGIECCYMLNYPEYGMRKRKKHNQLQGMCLNCKNKYECKLYKKGKEIKSSRL